MTNETYTLSYKLITSNPDGKSEEKECSMKGITRREADANLYLMYEFILSDQNFKDVSLICDQTGEPAPIEY